MKSLNHQIEYTAKAQFFSKSLEPNCIFYSSPKSRLRYKKAANNNCNSRLEKLSTKINICTLLYISVRKYRQLIILVLNYSYRSNVRFNMLEKI